MATTGAGEERETRLTVEEAGRELDALVEERVFGRTPEWRTIRAARGNWRELRLVPHYSTDIAAAWLVVTEVQRTHPGWRFVLLGGDVTFGYIDNSPSKGVDRSRVGAFGWNAEFFGHLDPSKDYGGRHGEAHTDSPALAICLAALRAVSESTP